MSAEHTVLGGHVSDILATARNLGACGVAIEQFDGMDQNELGIWASPSGAEVACRKR